MAARSVIVLFSIFILAHSKDIPSINEYFPDLAGDLTKIEWFHAVNNQNLLEEALNSSVHMLEADVTFGLLKNGSGPMPIMGHPPAIVSDLSLEEFVTAVIGVQNEQKKGIKLDFKNNRAYSESWKFLDNLKEQLTFPVWLNADILKGPYRPTAVPLNASAFVGSARDHLPSAPLSLGWTTDFKEDIGYSEDMLNEMLAVIQSEQVKQPITLAVRAAFAANTNEGLINLVKSIDKFQEKEQTTLTVWMSSTTDIVNISGVKSLLSALTHSRVALDVPEDIRDQILGNSASKVPTRSLLSYLSVMSLFSSWFTRS